MATKNGGWQSAVCAEHPMVAGAHYVEMTVLEKGSYGAMMGVVGQGFDVVGGGVACGSTASWWLSTGTGNLCHSDDGCDWEGQPQMREIKAGDVVGLLLDLGQATEAAGSSAPSSLSSTPAPIDVNVSGRRRRSTHHITPSQLAPPSRGAHPRSCALHPSTSQRYVSGNTFALALAHARCMRPASEGQ
eukprot:COSAG06_NODE_1449_length_9437_cov_292.962305_4_plen_188_part_00